MLEKFGTAIANVGQIAAHFQDALSAENDTAMKDHAEFKAVLADVLTCCQAHQNALDEAIRTHEAVTKSLLSFGPAADAYQAARTERIQNMIGVEIVPAAQHQEAA